MPTRPLYASQRPCLAGVNADLGLPQGFVIAHHSSSTRRFVYSNRLNAARLSSKCNALNLTISLALVVSSKQPSVIAALYRREAAEALKARNIPAQGKHAESVRRPG